MAFAPFKAQLKRLAQHLHLLKHCSSQLILENKFPTQKERVSKRRGRKHWYWACQYQTLPVNTVI